MKCVWWGCVVDYSEQEAKRLFRFCLLGNYEQNVKSPNQLFGFCFGMRGEEGMGVISTVADYGESVFGKMINNPKYNNNNTAPPSVVLGQI